MVQGFVCIATNIRRDRTLNGLERIRNNSDRPNGVFPFIRYEILMRELIFKRLTEGYPTQEGVYIPRNDGVCDYLMKPVLNGKNGNSPRLKSLEEELEAVRF